MSVFLYQSYAIVCLQIDSYVPQEIHFVVFVKGEAHKKMKIVVIYSSSLGYKQTDFFCKTQTCF